ncbi:MAG TPA: hypothetical protein VHX61_20065 [Rhizomicrobium sp.]|nr:hypothetical protein [Rhizomicrobium sp.]
MRRSLCAFAAAVGLTATGARADVAISNAATRSMTCSGGVCAPTAEKAVLNMGDLETLLASGNVEVTTTGARPKDQAANIDVEVPLGWSGAGALSRTHTSRSLSTKP